MSSFKQRAITAGLYLSGAEGPFRRVLDRLRRAGLSERMLKSALAAGLAWQAGEMIHTSPMPVLAPVTAVFTIQLTVAKSIGGTVQRLLGVIFGIFAALLILSTLGANAATVGGLVLITLYGGRRLGLEQSGVEQMTVSALLVLIAGSTTRSDLYAGFHLLDTAIGAAVGLILNGLIAPPSHVGAARASVQALGARLVEVLDDLAGGFSQGMNEERATDCLDRARAIAADLDETQAALVRAEDSLRFNLPGRPQRAALIRYRGASRALEHGAVQTRVISRTVLDAARSETDEPWLTSPKLGTALAELFSALARYLESFLLALEDPAELTANALLLNDVRERRLLAETAVLNHPAALFPGRWVLLGELLSISDQFVTDLSLGDPP